jgi:DNA-binding CsgD family transcriptional regulator
MALDSRCTVLRRYGRFDDARRDAEELIQRTRRLEGLDLGGWLALARVLLAQGDAHGALAPLQTALNIAVGRNRTAELQLLVEAEIALGNLDAAADRIRRASAIWRSNPSAGLLYVRAHLSRFRGELDAAEEDALQAARRSLPYREIATWAVRVLGTVAVDRGDYAEGLRLLGCEQAQHDGLLGKRMGIFEPEFDDAIARSRAALGEDAFDKAWAQGYAMTIEEAVAYVERGRGERKRPSSGWGSLTPTELQVARLVAEGLTNPQIGQRMFISRTTVRTHMSSIFAKLGMSTRSELAAEVIRRNAGPPADPSSRA